MGDNLNYILYIYAYKLHIAYFRYKDIQGLEAKGWQKKMSNINPKTFMAILIQVKICFKLISTRNKAGCIS